MELASFSSRRRTIYPGKFALKAVISHGTKLTMKPWKVYRREGSYHWNTAENFGEFVKRCKLQVSYKNAREKPEEFGVCMLVLVNVKGTFLLRIFY